MLVRIWRFVLRVIGLSFLLWLILSTTIPQIIAKYSHSNESENLACPYNSITSPSPLPIHNANVYFIIGHPDDEVMFFFANVNRVKQKGV